jgi:hypothetical protein
MNELTGTITLSSGLQTRASDKRLVDSLEGMVKWGYDSLHCLRLWYSSTGSDEDLYPFQTNVLEEAQQWLKTRTRTR